MRAARNLLSGVTHVVAVVAPMRAELRRILEAAGCGILESERTAQGMGASLAAGIEATADAEGWIVALGDMPLIKPQTIVAVKAALEAGAKIAAPFDQGGRRGHPVGFGAALRTELLALEGDLGARDVLRRHAADIVRIETDDAGIFVDIDTPQDLAGLSG